MVKLLGQQNCSVTTLDDLSYGHRDAVLYGDFVQGNFGDSAVLDAVLAKGFDAVMHFASFIQVGESVQYPDKYYRNNVTYTLGLLDKMRAHGINKFIFSSTAATFGEPQYTPIDERHPQQPINPYGHTKLMVEQALADYDRAYGFKSVCLRYFNAAGADPEGQLGERHDPETHLIPLVLQAASGRRPHIRVFGQDYDTPDGTCIRDYIHINDLCSAHWLALQTLLNGQGSQAYNLGNGYGFSVQEVIDTAQQVTGRSIAVQYTARRIGDPARLVADASLARQQLGWQTQYADLSTIIAHTWAWEQKMVLNT
jgi:UDP-glucose 4-epimerase